MKVTITPQALADLEAIYLYIADHSYECRADDYIRRIEAFCMILATIPKRGTAHDDILQGLRTVSFERRATVAFVVTENAILVEGVFYGGRDWQTRFTKS